MKCKVVITKQKEKITDENALYNEVEKAIKISTSDKMLVPSVLNAILHTRHKQFEPEVINVTELDHFPRNEFPIDELEYDGKFYKFLKTRLTVDASNNAVIQYVFDGGKEELDRHKIADELIDSILQGQ